MKKFATKIIVFLVFFSVLFALLQTVLHYHWPEDTYTRYIDYTHNPKDSIDVFVFGTSEMYSAFSPVTTYLEEGITAYNFSLQNRSAMTTYYQLMYALKYQTPKAVVCDFVCLFDNMLPSESETIYRRFVDTMPDYGIKSQMISEICRVDESESPISWYLPMLRYHSMWNELTPEDFKKDNVFDNNYSPMKKGCNLAYAPFDGEPYDITPDLWVSTDAPAPLGEFSVSYYDKIIDECNKRGIKVICMLTPKVCDAAVYAVNVPTMQQYFDSKGVQFINYCDYEKINEMGLSMYTDYSDSAHLNAVGAVKFSKYMAHDLKKMCDFPDRRLDENVSPAWNAAGVELAEYIEECLED